MPCLMNEGIFVKEPGCFIDFDLSTTIQVKPKCFCVWKKMQKKSKKKSDCRGAEDTMQVTYTRAGFLAHSPNLFFL